MITQRRLNGLFLSVRIWKQKLGSVFSAGLCSSLILLYSWVQDLEQGFMASKIHLAGLALPRGMCWCFVAFPSIGVSDTLQISQQKLGPA